MVRMGVETQRAEDAAVGDGERAAAQILEGQLAVAGLGGEVGYAAFDLGEVLVVGVADDGHDEPLVRRDGHADVVVLLEDELAVLQLGVDLGEGLERAYGRLGEEAHEAEAGAGPLLERPPCGAS